MPDEQVDIAAFIAIRDQYAADYEKADRDFEKAKEKLAAAKSRLVVANDMIAKATGKETTKKPLSEEILRIVNEHGNGGLSAKDIRDKFIAEGITVDLSAIHVNADRLKRRNAIEMVPGEGRTKLFMRKTTSAPVATESENGTEI